MIGQKCILNKLIYLVMIIVIGFTSLGLTSKENENKIHSNIMIQNIDVGQLTEKQAIDKLKSVYHLKDFNIIYNNEKWTIKSESIDLNYHIEEGVKEAFNYTRNSSTLKNIKRKGKLNLKKSHNIKLKATYNEIKLSKELELICNSINVDAANATFHVELNGQLKITESKEGKQVDLSRLKEYMYDMINKKKIENINLPVIILYPDVSTKQVKSINSVLGQFSTSFNNSTSRGSNIHVAAKQTSDILLMPGDTFSYNKCTGVRNWANGYKSAPVIVGGKVTNGEGGGVCQVSTTIYNAALMSGLTIDEVHNHSLPSRYVQRGRDATVSYGYTDLKFSNPFTHPIYIKNVIGNGAITSKIYGCNSDRERIYIKIEEEYTKDKITVQTYRLFLDDENNIMKKELIGTSVYKPN